MYFIYSKRILIIKFFLNLFLNKELRFKKFVLCTKTIKESISRGMTVSLMFGDK